MHGLNVRSSFLAVESLPTTSGRDAGGSADGPASHVTSLADRGPYAKPSDPATPPLIVTGERHFNRILATTQDWYNSERSHSARDHLPPSWDKPPKVDNTATPSEIVCTTRLGGLLNSYSRRAA